METQVQTLRAIETVKADDVFVIVLVTQNIVDVDICGRNTSAWVEKAVSAYKYIIVPIRRGDDIISMVRANAVKDKKYCVVVYADTPLVRAETIDQALSFAATYCHKVVQMPRGWIFEMEGIDKLDGVESVFVPNLDEVDFTVAYNHAQVALITSYARQRINDAHMANGVHISDPYATFIDVDVTIGAGTTVCPNAVLRGADIGKDCYIGAGVVFSTFDGEAKATITVGRDVYIGDKSVLVAPISVGDKARIRAASVIAQDVPKGALAMARARQSMLENFRTKNGEGDNPDGGI